MDGRPLGKRRGGGEAVRALVRRRRPEAWRGGAAPGSVPASAAAFSRAVFSRSSSFVFRASSASTIARWGLVRSPPNDLEMRGAAPSTRSLNDANVTDCIGMMRMTIRDPAASDAGSSDASRTSRVANSTTSTPSTVAFGHMDVPMVAEVASTKERLPTASARRPNRALPTTDNKPSPTHTHSWSSLATIPDVSSHVVAICTAAENDPLCLENLDGDGRGDACDQEPYQPIFILVKISGNFRGV